MRVSVNSQMKPKKLLEALRCRQLLRDFQVLLPTRGKVQKMHPVFSPPPNTKSRAQGEREAGAATAQGPRHSPGVELVLDTDAQTLVGWMRNKIPNFECDAKTFLFYFIF